MKSVKAEGASFLSYLKKQKGLWKAGVLLAAGLILLFLGSTGSSAKTEKVTLSDEEVIEERLAELCSGLEGVGECKVMISCRTEGGGYGSTEQLVVESVVVLCRGGGSEKVKKELTELVTSLYGIGANRVKVGVLK